MLPCRPAFIPYLCAGDPDLGTTAAALKVLDEEGADIIELGVPYSVWLEGFVEKMLLTAVHAAAAAADAAAVAAADVDDGQVLQLRLCPHYVDVGGKRTSGIRGAFFVLLHTII